MWVEFVCSLLYSERFLPGLAGFHLLSKIEKSSATRECSKCICCHIYYNCCLILSISNEAWLFEFIDQTSQTKNLVFIPIAIKISRPSALIGVYK